jgi:hypothetical protein
MLLSAPFSASKELLRLAPVASASSGTSVCRRGLPKSISSTRRLNTALLPHACPTATLAVTRSPVCSAPCAHLAHYSSLCSTSASPTNTCNSTASFLPTSVGWQYTTVTRRPRPGEVLLVWWWWCGRGGDTAELSTATTMPAGRCCRCNPGVWPLLLLWGTSLSPFGSILCLMLVAG